ncbi:hypothetical protein LEN26_012389 [Aphanomyces euteiches]|nr:hypothetical protein LEN26_012389 [Aphanomyces euteiches]KAH9129319.1 hypothetical protein AeMF1_000605 [Aphanomyces euteiches]
MEDSSDVIGAPSVWMAPDWSDHPVVENFYGAGTMSSMDSESPYDAVFSPMAKHMNIYGDADESPGSLKKTHRCVASLSPRISIDSSISTMRSVIHDYRGGDNPQGGMSPPSTHLHVLRQKLEASLDQVETKIRTEKQHYDNLIRNKASTAAPSSPPGLFGLFFCAASTDTSVSAPLTDDLPRLCEAVSRAAYHRGLNQLQRHRRHIHSLLNIVNGHHVTDLALTAKEFASLTSVEQMLRLDIKYQLLSWQRGWLEQLSIAREQSMARRAVTGHNQLDHNSHMKRLLEAASWYRWLQTHGRDSAVHPEPKQDNLADVLSGEEFFAEYYDLMATKEWWSVVQAQFENLVVATLDPQVARTIGKVCGDAATLYCEAAMDGRKRTKSTEYFNVHYEWLRTPRPDDILQFADMITRRVRDAFAIQDDVHKSLYVFMQRMLYPRMTMLCFGGAMLQECARRDKLWRSKQAQLRTDNVLPEALGLSKRIADKLREKWKNGTSASMFPDARQAFSSMTSWVPCDLLDEMMHGVVVLHCEASEFFGTTRIAVDAFFPLLSLVLLYSDKPFVHAQLHLLEQYALANTAGDQTPTRNGEESYYVYCLHAAVEHICSFSHP